jgi:hypothetical protein
MKVGFLDRHMVAVYNSRQTDALLIFGNSGAVTPRTLPQDDEIAPDVDDEYGDGKVVHRIEALQNTFKWFADNGWVISECAVLHSDIIVQVYRANYGKFKSVWEARRGVDEMRFGQLGVSNDIEDPIEGSGPRPGISSVLVEKYSALVGICTSLNVEYPLGGTC